MNPAACILPPGDPRDDFAPPRVEVLAERAAAREETGERYACLRAYGYSPAAALAAGAAPPVARGLAKARPRSA